MKNILYTEINLYHEYAEVKCQTFFVFETFWGQTPCIWGPIYLGNKYVYENVIIYKKNFLNIVFSTVWFVMKILVFHLWKLYFKNDEISVVHKLLRSGRCHVTWQTYAKPDMFLSYIFPDLFGIEWSILYFAARHCYCHCCNRKW